MQILVLSNCPVVESQGSGYVIINTAKSLTALGHKVDLIPPSDFSFLPSWNNRANLYRLAIGMARWIYQNKNRVANYQLIMFYGAESWLAVILLKKLFKVRVPVMLNSNGLEVHVDYRLNYFKRYFKEKSKWYHFNQSFLFGLCYRNVDAILTVSKYDMDFATGFMGIPAEKIFYNEPCLPDIFFQGITSIFPVKRKIITYCGSWIERKGINAIESAVPRILREFPDYTFRIIGVGASFEVAKSFPQDIINSIEIFPFVESKKDLVQLYQESSIFLFPSFCESFGLVVAEAMFCQCAVITGPTGIAADIKNHEEAIVLEIPDDQQVYNALEKVITDKHLRDTLSHNGKKRVEKLNWNKYTASLDIILNKILAEFERK